MQIADLYIRVSTDEQADKGYSQRNQEELLRRYCEMKSVQIRKLMFEDHSDKTFGGPNGLPIYRTYENIRVNPTWCYSRNGAGSAIIRVTPTK